MIIITVIIGTILRRTIEKIMIILLLKDNRDRP